MCRYEKDCDFLAAKLASPERAVCPGDNVGSRVRTLFYERRFTYFPPLFLLRDEVVKYSREVVIRIVIVFLQNAPRARILNTEGFYFYAR